MHMLATRAIALKYQLVPSGGFLTCLAPALSHLDQLIDWMFIKFFVVASKVHPSTFAVAVFKIDSRY